jgi:hypothetical protein
MIADQWTCLDPHQPSIRLLDGGTERIPRARIYQLTPIATPPRHPAPELSGPGSEEECLSTIVLSTICFSKQNGELSTAADRRQNFLVRVRRILRRINQRHAKIVNRHRCEQCEADVWTYKCE